MIEPIDNTYLANFIELDPAINTMVFIQTAHELLVECCSPTESFAGYSDNRLSLIEGWLSAHFYAIRDQRVVSEQAGEVSATYQSKIDFGLKNTHWGQQALRLDTNGGLAALDSMTENGGKIRIGIMYAGNNSGCTVQPNP